MLHLMQLGAMYCVCECVCVCVRACVFRFFEIKLFMTLSRSGSVLCLSGIFFLSFHPKK